MLLRSVWFLIGALATALAFAGVFLPLLPTTPFLLVGVFAFSRSSPRARAYLESHRWFGPILRNWSQHKAIDRRTKRVAATVMAATFITSALLGVGGHVLVIQAAVLSLAAAFVLTRPEGGPDDRA